MEAPAKLLLRLREGITEIESRDCFENGLEWIGFVLSCVSRGEAVQAFGALVNLQRLHSVTALALLDGVLALALRAQWIRNAVAGIDKETCCSEWVAVDMKGRIKVGARWGAQVGSPGVVSAASRRRRVVVMLGLFSRTGESRSRQPLWMDVAW
jgi:hypothetical protein